ncbi:zinc-dependent peptidase [Flavobacterium sp.]|uniref:zinc-dependent peptidase n=1 Tax=Flavobacterium sp. TaxID=239 RepID=UPI00261175EC|nr:zinc-dependent peptidase [Flavobacterium sp.]MDD2985215.1 zinc-dependent peptidase [Flavobacterium sp.]
MEGVFIVIFILLSLIVVLFFAVVLDTFEHFFAKIFHRPVYVHFYWNKQTVSLEQQRFLKETFPFYSNLEVKKRHYFNHRMAVFLTHYQFISKEDLVITEEMKVMISASAIMLTFGMRNYLVDVFDKIILYPEAYYSTHNDAWHKGEFNPRMKAIVFSWKDFLEGFQQQNDNLNLGFHEFTHAVHFHGLKRNDVSALLFAQRYTEIMTYIAQPAITEKLIQSNYFRIYGYTNSFEFIAVLIEHFFETPAQFKSEFPTLFEKVSKMINFSHKT